jgi:hypothetical protein
MLGDAIQSRLWIDVQREIWKDKATAHKHQASIARKSTPVIFNKVLCLELSMKGCLSWQLGTGNILIMAQIFLWKMSHMQSVVILLLIVPKYILTDQQPLSLSYKFLVAHYFLQSFDQSIYMKI